MNDGQISQRASHSLLFHRASCREPLEAEPSSPNLRMLHGHLCSEEGEPRATTKDQLRAPLCCGDRSQRHAPARLGVCLQSAGRILATELPRRQRDLQHVFATVARSRDMDRLFEVGVPSWWSARPGANTRGSLGTLLILPVCRRGVASEFHRASSRDGSAPDVSNLWCYRPFFQS